MGTRKKNSQIMRFPAERQVPREKHVPSGRALHLIDIENLMGGPKAGAPVLRQTVSDYRDVVPAADHDHYVIGVNPSLGHLAVQYWPSARLVVRRGRNGADIALIECVKDVEFTAARFDRIVIGSGDGIFVHVVRVFRRLGLPVEVVVRQGLSHELAVTASVVRTLRQSPLDLAA